MKKRITVLMALALALCVALFALASCSGGGSSASASGSASASSSASSAADDEAAISALLKEIIDSFNSGKESGIESGLSEDPELAALFETVKIDPAEYGAAVSKVISLEAGNIKIDGDTATADLILTAPDYEAISSSMDSAFEEATSTLDASNITEEELYAEVGKAIMKVMNDPNLPTKSSTVKAEFSKKNGEWNLSNTAELMTSIKNAYNV